MIRYSRPRAWLSALLSVFIFGSAALAQAQAQDKLYGATITVPADAGPGLKAAADDTAQALLKMTGKPFVVGGEYGAAGICLARTDSPLAPADAKPQLAGKGREPFLIRSAGAAKLWIFANRDEGLTHGLYFYLEQLGVRFYFPTDKWTIIPRRDDVTLKIDRLQVPDFKMRSFSGTGGFGGNTPVDPKRQMQVKWALWKQRNRFGGEFTVGGHTGEAFNTKYKDVLLAHPEYMAKVNGKHVPWSLIAKLNTANPDLVALYVKFRLDALRLQRQRDPNGINGLTVSAEPADGGGDCNSEECLKIGNGSPSDQAFYMANQVAKAVAKEFPEVRVTLLAYNTHAAVPSLPLEPNLYVLVTPYAFQRTGLTPPELIKAWGGKITASGMGSMGIYDYWSIPDWQLDLPGFNYLRTPGEKLRLWHANKVDGFASESNFGAATMGLAWYVSSRLMWDVKTDENAIIAEFYRTAFGKAAPPMQTMLERWANGFMLTDQELALSYRDMQAALKLADSPEITARLADYGRYLQYLRLRYEWQSAGGAEKAEAANLLARHLWSVYDSTMVHSYRLFQLLGRDQPSLLADYKYSNKDAPGWQDVHPIEDAEILRLVADGAKVYQPLAYEARRFTGPLVPLAFGAAPGGGGEPVSMTFSNNVTFEIQVPAGVKELRLRAAPQKTVRFRLGGDGGENLFDQTVTAKEGEAGMSWTEVKIPVPAPGRYTLEAQCFKVRFTMEIPQGIAFTSRVFFNSQGQPAPRLYFYVPRGLKTLAVHFSYPLIPRFYDNAGTEAAPSLKKGPGIALIEVPPGQDGKVWSMTDVRTPKVMSMLNAPQLFGFYPDTLLVPKEALQ